MKDTASSVVPILVVDDRKEDALALEEVLKSPDYEIVTATRGNEALRRVLDKDFAVILLDVMMPEMDGFELATLIRRRERSRYTPIIFLTAAGSDGGTVYKAYSVGAVDYLQKPIDRDLVRAKVSIFADLFRKDRHIQFQAAALREADRRERDLELAALQLRSRQRYHNLAEAIPQVVWTAKPDGALDYSNRRWTEYTGLELEDTLGDGWLAAIHPEDATQCERQWRAAVAKGEGYRAHCRIRRGYDGMFRWHLGHAVPELDDSGTLVGWLGTYTDFEDLKRALDARDEFLSIASHELRTPMTALQLQLQNLRRLLGAGTDGLGATGPAKVDKAIAQLQRLARLVDDLLDVSRITSGQLQLEPEPCDLATSAREVVDRLSEAAARAGCAITVRAERGAVVGTWDRVRMEQVVTNLVSNAFRYAAKAPVEITVERVGDCGRLVVRDHGPGIPIDALPRIFGRFERGSPSRHQGGLGIGLYIAREIVQAHGGTISATSDPGSGATFTVELPIADARSASQPPTEAAEARGINVARADLRTPG